MHIVARVGGAKRKWANVSYWASELNDDNWGWSTVTGWCGTPGRSPSHFRMGKGGYKACEELTITVKMVSAAFTSKQWTVAVKGHRSYATTGPSHRLDVSFNVRGDYAARNLPHGLFGQSFSSAAPREGLTDVYPERPGPGEHFVTKAMAEGAIEGTAAMYEVAAPYSTEFAFSRFDALPEDSSREGSSHEHQFESRNSDGRLTVDLE